MKLLFWAAVSMIGYTYVGYFILLFLRTSFWPKPILRIPAFPQVSIIMVVRNEGSILQRKLENLMRLNYPANQLEIVAVSDGSSDDTNATLAEFAGPTALRVIVNPNARGKASCINDAMAVAQGEIVVFMDARQKIAPDALRFLMENFADPTVGCVSGQLVLGDQHFDEVKRGIGLYWRIEKKIRTREAKAGSVVGATGALYAVRRHLVANLPPGTILDDLYIPMHVLKQGLRVTFDERALAWDVPSRGRLKEFERKVRTLSGNYQLLQLAPWLLTSKNPARLNFISHKILRLLMPFALAVAMITAPILTGPIYKTAFVLQAAFYLVGIWELISPTPCPLASIADAASTFVLLNTAALVAFANFVSGRKAVWAS